MVFNQIESKYSAGKVGAAMQRDDSNYYSLKREENILKQLEVFTSSGFLSKDHLGELIKEIQT